MSLSKAKTLFPVFFLFALFLISSCRNESQDEKRILVFSKTEGYRHESIEAGKLALMKLGAENNIKVDTTENSAYFTEDSLNRYSAVVFLNTTMDILDHRQEIAFERFIQSGGGFVGVHSAADTEYDWPWYGKLVGAYFHSHPGDPNVRTAVLEVKDKNNPATSFLPERWERMDEWYNYKSINPKIKVLATLDTTSYEDGVHFGREHPIAWYHEYDGGRAFYTGGGHTDESFSEPLFLQHLLEGIQYAIGENRQLDYSKAHSKRVP
ncbi:MAG: ThuA domain-containing protein [Bacteroidota bacterium]|nr:ThuA domain-containing protein [Bacteroidota bacterium]